MRPPPRLRQGASQGGSTASKRLARWWSVRSAGGLYQVFKRFPEALPRMSLAQLTEMAGPLASKAGLRLSRWRAVRLLKDGAEVVLAYPSRARAQIRRRPGRPGRRRSGRNPQDGRVSEEPPHGAEVTRDVREISRPTRARATR